MAKLIQIKTYREQKGDLTVIQKEIPFQVKRIYYIYNCDGSVRGKHRHKITQQAIICISRSVDFYCNDSSKKVNKFILNKPDQLLIVNPEDYHWFDNFSKNSIILVLASEYYTESDYIYDNY